VIEITFYIQAIKAVPLLELPKKSSKRATRKFNFMSLLGDLGKEHKKYLRLLKIRQGQERKKEPGLLKICPIVPTKTRNE